MPTVESIQAQLTVILAKAAHIRPDDISGRETLDMLGIDSAGTLSLAAHIEEEFGVVIDAEAIIGNVSIAEIAARVAKKSAHGEGTA